MIGWAIGGVLAFVALAVVMRMCAGGTEREPDEDEGEHCIDWHRRNGGFQVVYPDGEVSQPFTFKVARDYQKLFGGAVVTARRRIR